ncbi:MAG: hypothetical protein J0I06_12415 [Planctomycetes bacterium]|nr:hypothetical protein [Planctomycetota bacterium]
MGNPWQVYVVARVGWHVEHRSHASPDFHPASRDTAAPEDRRFVPVAAFAVREAAEVRMRELELEAARIFNPFGSLGPPSVLSSLPVADLCRRLGELVGPLPVEPFDASSRLRHWRLWWDEHAPTWSDETLAAVWELLDAVRFYAILEVDANEQFSIR